MKAFSSFFKTIIPICVCLLLIGCSNSRDRYSNSPDGQVPKVNFPLDSPGMSFDRDDGDNVFYDSETGKADYPIKINLFIENSASMNGFINDASSFQNAITALVSKLKNVYGKDNINLGFINASIVAQHGDDPYQLVNKMLVKSNFTNAGSTSTTDLNNLIKQVLDNTDDNTVSFFVSDCIYSIKNDKSTTTTRLEGCQNGTMDKFQEKLKEFDDLSILFIRMESNFNGGYWDYKHPSGTASQQLKDCNRPYFICVVGSDRNIKELNSRIRMEDLKGYGQQYYLSGKDYSNTFYTAISRPYNKGRYKVEDFSTIRLNNTKDLQFAIAINLDGFPMSKEEKMDLANYVIDGNFNKVDLVPIDSNIEKKLSPNEINNIKSNGCTHLLVVSSNGFPSDFTIKVKPTIPEWVNELSSIDDTGISNDNKEELRKTFGISYFINGAAAAYERDSYFTMSIKIKQ